MHCGQEMEIEQRQEKRQRRACACTGRSSTWRTNACTDLRTKHDQEESQCALRPFCLPLLSLSLSLSFYLSLPLSISPSLTHTFALHTSPSASQRPWSLACRQSKLSVPPASVGCELVYKSSPALSRRKKKQSDHENPPLQSE